MPRGPLVSDHITEVVIEDINHLIVRDRLAFGAPYISLANELGVHSKQHNAYQTYQLTQFDIGNPSSNYEFHFESRGLA